MDGFNGEVLGQAIAVTCMAVMGAYTIWKGHRKSDGTPPENRPPPVNETRAALEALRERIEHHNGLAEDDRRDMARQLDRIERTVERICDRLDADARIGAALARIGRQEG